MQKVDDKTLLALCLTGHSQVQIAKELGMTKAAICKRINKPSFQELLSEYRRKVLDGILTQLIANSQLAVLTLVELLDDENSFVRLKAATEILHLSQDYSTNKDMMHDIEILMQSAENANVYNKI